MKKKTVSAHLFDFLFRYAQKFNIDRESVCKAAGIKSGLVDEPDSRINAIQFAKAWDYISSLVSDTTFGLNLGRNITGFPFSHITFSVMQNSKDLNAALVKFIQYHNLVSNVTSPEIREEKKTVSLALKASPVEVSRNNQYVCFIFTMIISLLKHLSASDISPIEVCFSEKESPGSRQAIQAYFKCRVIYGAGVNRIVFNRQDLASKVRLADGDLLFHFEMAAEKRLRKLKSNLTWTQKVESVLFPELTAGLIPLEGVCKKLLVSRRTLQNRLKTEGTSFRQIQNRIRTEKAVLLLKDKSLPIIEIAFLLGFSEQSAFQNAFKRWTGSTPNVYRKNIV